MGKKIYINILKILKLDENIKKIYICIKSDLQ